MKQLFFFIISLTLIADLIYGQEEPVREDFGKITVEEEEDEAQALTHSPLPVTVIKMENFYGRNISLNEVLKRVAGVKVKEQGGLGSATQISIHGLEGNRVKVFIDGMPLNAPDGSFGINDLPIQLIERIEIYKGVVPAKFSADALGGAVNVVTREYDGDYVDITVGAGSYGTYRGAVVYTKKFREQKITWGVGGFFNQAANNYVMESPFVEGLKIPRDHDRFQSFLYATGITFEDRWFDKIEIELVRYESEKEIQGIQSVIKEAKTKSRANVFALELEKENFLADDLEFKYGLVYIDLQLHFIDKATTCFNFDGSTRPCEGETGFYPRDSKDKQTDVMQDVNLNYLLATNYALNFHFNHYNSRYNPKDDLANETLGYDIGAYPSDFTKTVTSLELESTHLNEKIVNQLGVKHYQFNAKITPQGRVNEAKPASSQNNRNETGYYESIRYEFIEDLFFKMGYEHTYRLPEGVELFGDGGITRSAPNLRPEEADSFYLGALFDRYNFYDLPWLKADVLFFFKNLKNMIRLQSQGFSSQYINQGKVRIEGFEVEVQTDVSERWYLYANFTNQSVKDQQQYKEGTKSTPNPTYKLDVPNIPKRYGNIGIDYKMFGLWQEGSLSKLFWETDWTDSYFYNWKLSRHQKAEIKAQMSHTAGVEYNFPNDLWIIGFEVRNLTDAKLTDVYNFPLPGRTYHLNVRYTWFEK